MWKTFGEFVRFRRNRLGLTQRQVADGLGLKSAAFLSDIEAGNRKPSRSLIPALARILETDVEDLMAYDTRQLITKVRRFLEDWPESARGFGLVVDTVRTIGVDEALRRLQSRVEPETGETPRKPRKSPATKKKASSSGTDILGL